MPANNSVRVFDNTAIHTSRNYLGSAGAQTACAVLLLKPLIAHKHISHIIGFDWAVVL